MAEEVSRRLGLPLDVVIASKIGAPGNEEYAIGAVDPAGVVTIGERAGRWADEIELLALPVRDKIQRRLVMYRRGSAPLPVQGQTVILVDDGIATGLTAAAAISYLRAQGAGRLVLAVPVMPADTAARIRERVDELVALETPEFFSAVGQFYRHFEQTSDDEVLATLGHAVRPSAE